jgi:hypothetical protein
MTAHRQPGGTDEKKSSRNWTDGRFTFLRVQALLMIIADNCVWLIRFRLKIIE